MQDTIAQRPTSDVTLLKGTWRYLSGIPGWDSWGTLEKKCEYVLSGKSVVINRRDASLSISLSAMQGVSLDCRWSRPRFLINYAASDGTSQLAVFEFHQALRASGSGKRLLLRLLELGVKPDTTLAGETAETMVAQPSPSPAAYGQAVTRSGPTQSQAHVQTDARLEHGLTSSVRLQGKWRYVGGIPGWQSWGSVEKDSEFVLSTESLDVIRDQEVIRDQPSYCIPLARIRGVALDRRWPPPVFLIEFATPEGVLSVAAFQFQQEPLHSPVGEHLLSKLMQLGVKPNATLGDGGPQVAYQQANSQNWGQPLSGSVPTQSQATTTPEYAHRVLVRIQGFALGFVFSIIGVIVVLVLSDERKRGDRALGALAGMVVWLTLMWRMGALDPWLAQYGLSAHECYRTFDGITCTGPWSPQ